MQEQLRGSGAQDRITRRQQQTHGDRSTSDFPDASSQCHSVVVVAVVAGRVKWSLYCCFPFAGFAFLLLLVCSQGHPIAPRVPRSHSLLRLLLLARMQQMSQIHFSARVSLCDKIPAATAPPPASPAA